MLHGALYLFMVMLRRVNYEIRLGQGIILRLGECMYGNVDSKVDLRACLIVCPYDDTIAGNQRESSIVRQ